MLIIDQDKCQKDGICFSTCPAGAINSKEDGSYEIDPDVCMECYSCMNICPSEAIYEDEDK
jgi:NAD-dependent dihydropyrimidine dehydrogenase PreA subunit